MGDQDWFDGYDLEEVLGRGDSSDFQIHIGSLGDGTAHGSAAELAEAFGSPVFEPTRWPDGSSPPRYVRSAPVAPFVSVPGYRIFADLPGHPATLLVNGSYAPIPHWPGEQGWYEHPDLAAMDGLAQWDGRGAHVVVRLEGQSVYVAMFPSVDEAVATAKSLRRVDPGDSS